MNGQLLCYVATTYGEKTAESVEAEIMAYMNVRNLPHVGQIISWYRIHRSLSRI